MKHALVVAFAVLVMCLPSALQAQSPARIAQPVDSTVVRIPHSTHPLASADNDLGRVDGDLAMDRMVLVLKPSADQQAAMLKLVDGLHNPDSPSYHQWLSPDQFGAKFGPADEDVAIVTNWLQQQGFRVSAVGRGKHFIEFSGTARQVENAFQTEIHRYVVKGEQHIANAMDISLPQALTPVVGGVLSLHNFHSKGSHGLEYGVHRDSATGKLVPDFTFTTTGGSAHFTAPGDFARIYNTEPLLAQKINGAGVSVAVMARSNIELSDVQIFRKMFGLPANDPLFVINGQDPGINGDVVEAALDVEWSGAAAPGATIKLVTSASTATADGVNLSLIYAIDNRVAPIVSTSFSACELFLGTAGNIFFNNLYEQAAAEGITAIASTGDTGSAGCALQVNGAPADRTDVSGLASTPFNVAVGGTEFAENGQDGNYWEANNRPDLSSALGYIPETIWNQSCDPTKDPGHCNGTREFFMIAGGGGPSTCIVSAVVNGKFVCQNGYAKPSWQAGRGVPNDGVRDLPDLALNAGANHDGSLMCVLGSCRTAQSNGQTILENATVIGGTSVSAPSMAGIMAIIEQKNGAFQGQANFNFYKLAAKDTLANCNSSKLTNPAQPGTCFFRDVTMGTNAVPDVMGFPAGAGYDMSSGLGSVNAAMMVAGWKTVPKLASATTLSSGAISARHGQPVPIAVAVKPTTGTGTPSGGVDLITDKFGSVLAGTLANGNFSGNVSDLPGGQYSVKASYTGDAMFSSSSSSSVAVNIAPESSVVKVIALEKGFVGQVFQVNGPVLYSQPVGLQIDVVGASGVGSPTGTVTVKDGNTTIATIPVARTGTAFLEVDGLPPSTGMLVGNHFFTVSYSGDDSFKPATSRAVRVNVTQAPVVTQIAPVSGTPITSGSPQELAILVDGRGIVQFPAGVENPTGTVQVFDNGKAISGHIPIAQSGVVGRGVSQAIFNTTFLAAGPHDLIAEYSGDKNYQLATSFPFAIDNTITVDSPAGTVPRITLEQSSSTVTLGQTAKYTAIVRPFVTGGPLPTGTVSFIVNAAALGGQVPLVNGVARFPLSFAAAGTFDVVANYSGDNNYTPFSSAVLTIQVTRGMPTVNLSSPSLIVAANTQTSLTANVIGAPTGPIISQNPNGVPTGTVQFFDSVNGGTAKPLGPPEFLSIGSNGNPIFSLPVVLPSGTNAITVKYSGDNNWLPGTSGLLTVTVR